MGVPSSLDTEAACEHIYKGKYGNLAQAANEHELFFFTKMAVQSHDRIYRRHQHQHLRLRMHQKPKTLQDSPSHRIFRRMHRILNIDENKN